MLLEEIKAHSQDANARLDRLYTFLKIDDYKNEMAQIENTMSQSNFWDNKDSAQETVQRLSQCKAATEPFFQLKASVENFGVMAELAAEDESFLAEADNAWAELSAQLDKLELVSFLSGKFDRNNCFFFIHVFKKKLKRMGRKIRVFRRERYKIVIRKFLLFVRLKLRKAT
ncbi:MAG: PCRF domain-containing protein, partial [Lentisphaeria bacterium]|nr:PCRF domain-containing protein [Lentisphaeria bacterium]